MTGHENYSDQQLLELMRLANDELAFTAIYDRYWKALYQNSYKVLQQNLLAQDVVQEVFLDLWQRRKKNQIDNLSAYLHQAVRFQVFKLIRAEKAGEQVLERIKKSTIDIAFQDPLMVKELDQVVNAIFGSLTDDQKRIFTMSREDGLTYREIAGQLNISVKTVEKKVSQSLRKIRFGLDESYFSVLLFILFRYF